MRIASQELEVSLQVLPNKPDGEQRYITPSIRESYEYSSVHVRPPFASSATATDKDVSILIAFIFLIIHT